MYVLGIFLLFGITAIFWAWFFSGLGYPAAKFFEAKYKPKFERTVQEAIMTKNPALCKDLIRKKYFTTDFDCDGCYTRYYENDCLSEYVKVYLDPTVCLTFSEGRSTNAPGNYRKEYFDKESCIQYVTKQLKDPAYCVHMSDLHEQIACRAVATRDLLLCFNKHVDKPEKCVEEIEPKRSIACDALYKLVGNRNEVYKEMVNFCSEERGTLLQEKYSCNQPENNLENWDTFKEDLEKRALPAKVSACYEKVVTDKTRPFKEIEETILREIFRIEMNQCVIDTTDVVSDCDFMLGDPPFCYKEYCISTVAKRNNDALACKNIQNEYYQKECIYGVALQSNNIAVCEILENKALINHCQAQAGKNLTPCNEYTNEADRTVCIYHVAFYAKDSTFCDALPTEENIRYFSDTLNKTEWVGKTSCKESICRYKPQEKKGCPA